MCPIIPLCPKLAGSNPPPQGVSFSFQGALFEMDSKANQIKRIALVGKDIPETGMSQKTQKRNKQTKTPSRASWRRRYGRAGAVAPPAGRGAPGESLRFLGGVGGAALARRV